jgi:5,5'-dehydrodivanillate O-demethylase
MRNFDDFNSGRLEQSTGAGAAGVQGAPSNAIATSPEREVEALDFVHTGPGTLAGLYLRQQWQPVYTSAALAPRTTAPIRVMGEDYTLYRGDDGKPHVVASHCPHRGMQLSTGFIEGSNLRCIYHGWVFDAGGECIEQPCEPKPFCNKIRIASYPTSEHFGLIFAYFGPTPPPSPPAPAELERYVVGAVRLPHACNYFQRAENNIDGVHVRFVHHATRGLGESARGTLTPTSISAHETAWGLTQVLEYAGVLTEKNHFIMPNGSYFNWEYGATGLRIHNRLWYVPIDDESHHLFVVTLVADDRLRSLLSASPSPTEHPPLDATVAAVLSGKSSFQALDKSRPDLILVQDAIVTCGLGAITDRSREHLGQTDVAVILLRQLWRRQLRALRAGKPLAPFAGSPIDLSTKAEY